MTFSDMALDSLHKNSACWDPVSVHQDPLVPNLHIVNLTSNAHPSFKYRGADLALRVTQAASFTTNDLTLVAVSSGNFGNAIAHAARKHGLKAVIFVPNITPKSKQLAILNQGAEVRVLGHSYRETGRLAREWVAKAPNARQLIHSNAEEVRLGAATFIHELRETHGLGNAEREALILPCGIGSMARAAALLIKEMNLGVDLFIAEAQGYAKVSALHGAGSAPRGGPTLAEGIAILTLSKATEAALNKDNIKAGPVSEEGVAEGMAHLWHSHGIRAEGAGAISTAFALKHAKSLQVYDKVWSLVTGRAISQDKFEGIMTATLYAKQPIKRPAVILSTGRSGSTALDRALSSHPKLCLISELFEPVGENPPLDKDSSISGEAFFELLDAPTMEGRRLAWEAAPTAEVLALPKEKPWSLLRCYTLPALAPEDPQGLAEEIKAWLCERPMAPPVAHLRALFDYLTIRSGAERWVERTGGSAYQVEKILSAFPDAHFVHLHRRGQSTADSMFRHPVFHAILQAHKGQHTPQTLEDFGAFWSEGVTQACQALAQLPPNQTMHVSYEDLCGPSSSSVLAELVAFLRHRSSPDVDDIAWAKAASQRFRPIAPPTHEARDRHDALTRACHIGEQKIQEARGEREHFPDVSADVSQAGGMESFLER